MSAARDEILDRIRSALADVHDDETPSDVPVDRGYRRHDDAPPAQLVRRFAERAAEYHATVVETPKSGLRTVLGERCRVRRVRRIVVPTDLPEAWRPDGVELVPDIQLPTDELDRVDGALTGCALAIAESGTLILDGGSRQGRRALTLVPDYHLCVVEAEQITGIVPQAIKRLGDAVRQRRPLTFISGPSATSDIELTRVEGVHGPRKLDIVIRA